MRSAAIVAALALSLVLARAQDASACSCVGPHAYFVGPDRADDAPLNTKVRLEVPAGATQPQGIKLRAHGGAEVEVASKTWPDGSLTFVELTPKAALQPRTRYEIAIVDAAAFPSTTVLGTFTTGATADTSAPKLTSVGAALAKGNAQFGGGSCSIRGPWIEIGPVVAEDPGRRDAKLAYAIWRGNAAGNVDVTKPPAALVEARDGVLTLGQRSLCDPHGFPIPKGAAAWLAIAAVDESGNTSPPKKVRVDLTKAPVQP